MIDTQSPSMLMLDATSYLWLQACHHTTTPWALEMNLLVATPGECRAGYKLYCPFPSLPIPFFAVLLRLPHSGAVLQRMQNAHAVISPTLLKLSMAPSNHTK